MGDFFGFNIGVSSLFAHRQALEIAGSNIANANTEGYSRQRVSLVNSGGAGTQAIHARVTTSAGGVMALSPQRMRDMFLEARSAAEHGTEGALAKSQILLTRLEGIFNEPSDTGLGAQMSDFWAGWEDLANNPGDLAARAQLLQRAGTLANSFNQAKSDLTTLWGASVEQLKTIVTGMNAAADRLAELNNSIVRATVDGGSPNALLDQRDALVQELGLAGAVTTTTRSDGSMDVYIGGTAIVRGPVSSHLQVTLAPGATINTANQPGSGVSLTWVKDGFPATISSGESGGILDGLNRMLPNYLDGIDAVARQLASAVNIQHNLGADLNGVQPGSVVGSLQPGITIGAGTNQFILNVNGNGPRTVTLANAAYAADAAGAAALQADLQTKINAALVTPPDPAGAVVATVRVEAGQLRVALTSAAPAGSIAIGPGIPNALAPLGLPGISASTDSFFGFSAAGNLQVIVTDPRNVAGASGGAGLLDGGNALDISNIGTLVGGPDDTYRSFIIGLGVETQATERRVGIQHSIVTQLDTQREANAGVSLDEEMANLMQFQRGYEAAARLINTVDGLLETLIGLGAR